MDATKATGLDCIGPRLLKIVSNVLTPSITCIINKSIESGGFPCTWKNAKVNPIFKIGDKDSVNNYRHISISLLTTFKKLKTFLLLYFGSFRFIRKYIKHKK